jgi:hypothetical protein
MAALRFTQTRVLPFRVALKAALLAGIVVILPLYSALVGAETGHPVRGALKGLILLLAVAIGALALWRLVRWIRFRRGGPGLGPPPPQVREPRPPGGRPPALSAAARPEADQWQ